MNRRRFLRALGIAPAAAALGCSVSSRPSAGASGTRRLKRVGIQLYSLRDDARRDLDGTLAAIAAAGYDDVEMLGSANNYGSSPAQVREMLDRHGLRARSTHVAASALDDLDRQLDGALAMGHDHLIVAGFPAERRRTLDDYRYWADRLNGAGAESRKRGVWVGFHNHADDLRPIAGAVPYDLLAERTDPSVVRLQLDTGNLAMAGRDPMEYMRRFGDRYWLFHIKDVPSLGASADTELGKGVIDFRRLLASIERIDEKHLFVEQETYPGAPIESVRRDYRFISALEF